VALEIKHATEWGVTELYLGNKWDDVGDNNRETLVKEIVHVSFSALTYLDLHNNQVQSIEVLPNLHMPHI
jgi:Leucine-rich repeat (LRR) protein